MLSNIVTAALAPAPDIVVVGHVADIDDLADQIRLTGADAVIVQTNRPGAATTFLPLLRTFSTLKVVAIDATGSGYLHQLRPYSFRFADVSADALLGALRAPSTPIRRAAGS